MGATGPSSTGTGTATGSPKSPSSFAHAGPADTGTRIAPAVITMANAPSLTSADTSPGRTRTSPDRGPGRPRRDTPPSGMPAGKETSRSNQKPGLATTGRTA